MINPTLITKECLIEEPRGRSYLGNSSCETMKVNLLRFPYGKSSEEGCHLSSCFIILFAAKHFKKASPNTPQLLFFQTFKTDLSSLHIDFFVGQCYARYGLPAVRLLGVPYHLQFFIPDSIQSDTVPVDLTAAVDANPNLMVAGCGRYILNETI